MFRLKLIFIGVSFFATSAVAQSLPQNFVIEGRLFDSGTGLPINTTADIKLEVMVQGNTTCVFYRDTYTNINLSSTDSNSQGVFSLKLGGSTSPYKSSSVSSFTQIFSATTMNGDADGDGTEDASCANISTPLTTAYRVVRISVRSPSGSGSYVALSPDTAISSIPNALVADTLRGKVPSDFLTPNTSTSLSQTNLENIFSSANYTKLTSLLSGSDTDYIPSVPTAPISLHGQTLTNVSAPTYGTDAANKSYTDSNIGGKTADVTSVGSAAGDGFTLTWNQAQNKWIAQAVNDTTKLPLAGGTMAGAITMAGFDLYNTGHITMGTQRLLNLGTFTTAQETALALTTSDKGKILYNTTIGEIRVWNGTAFSGLTAPVTSVNGMTGAVTISTSTLGLGTAATKDVGTSANNVVQLNSSGDLPLVDGHLLFNLNAERLQGFEIANAAPANGDILKWNSTTSLWEPQADIGIKALTGDVIASGSGSVTATLANSSVTLAKINSSGGGVNRLLITDSTSGATVTYANCTTNQVMYWTSSGWVCSNITGLGAFVNNGNSFGTAASLGTTDSNSLSLMTNSHPQMTILTSGNVGIGTVAPGRNFVVQSSTSVAEASIVSTTGGTSNLYFGDDTDDVHGGILYDSTFNTMKFQTNDNAVATIDANGLAIFGSAANPASNAIAEFVGTQNTNSAIIVPRATTAKRPSTGVSGMIRYNTNFNKFEAFENGAWINMISSGGGGGSPSGSSGQIQYNNSGSFGGAANLNWDSTNNRLGVGTATPSTTLEVAGTVYSTSGGFKFPDGSTQTTAASNGSANFQEFTSSGTWTKPSGGNMAQIECWGGGGSGAAVSGGNSGGGGGGGYSMRRMSLSALSATVTVTIGAGGAASSGAGIAGSDTTFGSYLTAHGGSGGSGGIGGAGGSGGSFTSSAYPNTSYYVYYSGGSGNSSSSTSNRDVMWGGAGGGSCISTTIGTQGHSENGGAGGNASCSGSTNAYAGASPGGGGGGANASGGRVSGAGADGYCRVLVF